MILSKGTPSPSLAHRSEGKQRFEAPLRFTTPPLTIPVPPRRRCSPCSSYGSPGLRRTCCNGCQCSPRRRTAPCPPVPGTPDAKNKRGIVIVAAVLCEARRLPYPGIEHCIQRFRRQGRRHLCRPCPEGVRLANKNEPRYTKPTKEHQSVTVDWLQFAAPAPPQQKPVPSFSFVA